MINTKAEKDQRITEAKARWLTEEGMALRKTASRRGKAVWNTPLALRMRKLNSRDIKLLYTNTDEMVERMRRLLSKY